MTPNMQTNLTVEQKACNFETREHIANVQKFIHIFVKALLDRADKHDLSKLESPEVEAFTECTKELAGMTYGSPEYKESLKKLGPALEHHYAKNSHHPEHWSRGIRDMDLVDIIEMFCDWKAATMRHNDGNLAKSIHHNATRFGFPAELEEIFENTAKLVD